MKTSGLDVHKDSTFCAIYDGKSYSAVKDFSTTSVSIRELGVYLQSEKMQRVAIESAASYRVPIWDILYEMAFAIKLVNPLHIKQILGRKSDAKDAQWIAELLYRNMLRGSLVPSPLIQKLRSYTREYRNLVNQRTKVLTQMDRILVMCGIRLSSCISNIDSKSFMQVVATLIRGETDPAVLVRLVYGNRRNRKSGKLRECLTGNMKAHHHLKLTTCKQQFDLLEQQIELYFGEIQKICDANFREAISHLTTLPGVS
jgi:transposase